MVHEVSKQAEKDAYVMNYLYSAFCLEVKSACWVKEEDIKNALSNVFIRYSNAEHAGEWLLDQLALQEKVSRVTNTFCVLHTECTMLSQTVLFKTSVTIKTFSTLLNPTGMLKVWEWLAGSGLQDIKSVINGCVIRRGRSTAAAFSQYNYSGLHSQPKKQRMTAFPFWNSPSRNDGLARGTSRLLILFTDLMICVETPGSLSLVG